MSTNYSHSHTFRPVPLYLSSPLFYHKPQSLSRKNPPEHVRKLLFSAREVPFLHNSCTNISPLLDRMSRLWTLQYISVNDSEYLNLDNSRNQRWSRKLIEYRRDVPSPLALLLPPFGGATYAHRDLHGRWAHNELPNSDCSRVLLFLDVIVEYLLRVPCLSKTANRFFRF